MSTGQLTMGIIGCLPDNVQQAIKSFSITQGSQHVTLAFPFMEQLVKHFAEPPDCSTDRFASITPALLFDCCPEMIHGFETLVTLVPTTLRTSHAVGLLTVNQKGSVEGVKRHFESLVSLIASVNTLWHIPLVVSDLSDPVLDQVLEICSKRILETHGDTLTKMYPVVHLHDLLPLVKEKILKPSFLSYKALLQLNVQEVMSRLGSTTDPVYFQSLVQHLQSPACTLADFRRIHMYFMSPQLEPAIREMWTVWSHEQVTAKVFPVCSTNGHLGSLFYTTSPGGDICHSAALLGHVTHVPVKEGLLSIIKCLKNQDLALSPSTSPEDKPSHLQTYCACTMCYRKTDHCPMLRHYEKLSAVGPDSAFHRPTISSPGQHYTSRPPLLCSSPHYAPLPVVLNTSTSATAYPVCYKWRMFTNN